MSESGHPLRVGVAPDWKSRKSVIKDLRSYTPSSMDRAVAYNSRAEVRNKSQAVHTGSYLMRGGRRQMDAIASALEGGQDWKRDLAQSVTDLMFADRLDYFWHQQYDIVFPHMKGQLRMMDWVVMTNSLAFSLLLGW